MSFPTRLSGSEEAEDEGQWKLYFKLYCFLDVESMPKEGVEFAFMFEQVCFTHPVMLTESLYNHKSVLMMNENYFAVPSGP